jgi:hypothetical protein
MQGGQPAGCGSCPLHVHLQCLQDMQQGQVPIDCKLRTQHSMKSPFRATASHPPARNPCCMQPLCTMPIAT